MSRALPFLKASKGGWGDPISHLFLYLGASWNLWLMASSSVLQTNNGGQYVSRCQQHGPVIILINWCPFPSQGRTWATLTHSCWMTAYSQALRWGHEHLSNQVEKSRFCLPRSCVHDLSIRLSYPFPSWELRMDLTELRLCLVLKSWETIYTH